MKIRQDYVSNSSSSSFVIFGTKISETELMELWNKIPGHDSDKYKDYSIDEKIGLVTDKILCKTFTTSVVDQDFKVAFCGNWPDEMHDDETLLEFKERIAEKFRELGLDRPASEIKFYHGTSEDGYVSLLN